MTATAVAVVCCALWTIWEAAQALTNHPGHEPKPRRPARYRSIRRAWFARTWRTLLALIVALLSASTTVFAYPHAQAVFDKISNYARQNHPLRDKPTKPRPKPPERSFLEDPFGWLERSTKQPPEE